MLRRADVCYADGDYEQAIRWADQVFDDSGVVLTAT